LLGGEPGLQQLGQEQVACRGQPCSGSLGKKAIAVGLGVSLASVHGEGPLPGRVGEWVAAHRDPDLPGPGPALTHRARRPHSPGGAWIQMESSLASEIASAWMLVFWLLPRVSLGLRRTQQSPCRKGRRYVRGVVGSSARRHGP